MLHDSLGASVNMKQTVVFFVLMSCGLLFPKVTRPRGCALYSMPLSFRGAMSFDPSSQSTPKLSRICCRSTSSIAVCIVYRPDCAPRVILLGYAPEVVAVSKKDCRVLFCI